MTYEEILIQIHRRRTFSAGGPTLERIRRLMAALGDPQEKYPVVHIAGTNGKGSVSAMAAAALFQKRYRVGLFTSPYLVDFRERIQIDRQPISKEELKACYEIVIAQETRLEQQGFEPVNEFEFVTAIGFLAFSRAKVDYAVLEVGLGGRTDPTNLVKHPAACCVTSISFDHTAILGNTIEKIAWEKAGIIKKNCPVVIARQTEEAEAVLRRVAQKQNAPLTSADPVTPISRSRSGLKFLCGNLKLCIPLLGDFQMENAAAALKLCQVLGLPDHDIQVAFSGVSWPGRLQYFPQHEMLVDAGHNPAGIEGLCRTLDQLFAGQKIICILSMLRDKDVSKCIPMVAKRARLLIGTSVHLPRSFSPEEIVELAASYCPALPADSMETALSMAKQSAEPGDLLLVCGSVYGAGEVLRILSVSSIS